MKVLCGTYRWGWRGPTGGAGGDLPVGLEGTYRGGWRGPTGGAGGDLPGGLEGTYRWGRRGPTGGAGGDLPVGLEGSYRWGWRGPTGGTGGTYRWNRWDLPTWRFPLVMADCGQRKLQSWSAVMSRLLCQGYPSCPPDEAAIFNKNRELLVGWA
ncbi:unnamed protein product [Gadus morhua 'NCC']